MNPMRSSLTPSARQALAYLAIHGHFPKGIHVETRLAAYDHVEDADYETTGRFYTVPDATVYAETPLWKAHRALLAAGFVCRGNVRVRNGKVAIGKNLRYERLDDRLNGFSAELEFPNAHLYVSTVVEGRQLYTKSACAYVSAKNAGTLPDLIASKES